VPIGLTEDQRSLASSLSDWLSDGAMVDLVRAAAGTGPETFGDSWNKLSGLGVAGIALPESVGGGGGSLLDLACALEACTRGLVPGPLLSTAVAATLLSEHPPSQVVKRTLPGIADGSVSIGLAPQVAHLDLDRDRQLSGRVPVVWDAGTTTHLLVGTDQSGGDQWFLVDASAEGVRVQAERRLDLSRTVGTVQLEGVDVADGSLSLDEERVRAVTVTLAAAEAAGIAGWTLDTAVDYAKVREQFGRKIGSFQSIKHLCAQMLELSESATAVAWDASSAHAEQDDRGDQFAFSSAVAGSVALDAAVTNAKECIQILGGIGFTWEHDAHLYLRRAISTRQLMGGTDPWRLRAADQALAGVRRRTRIDFEGQDERLRARAREQVAEIAQLPPADRRTPLADAGLLAPHWPTPYGLDAGPVEQLVIDEELDAASVVRPDLAIGAWAIPTILAHGSDEQQRRFVPATLRGEIAWCQLFSEPGAGSDLASLRTRADRVDGGWRLSGQKVWTSLATEADWAICLARTNPDSPPHKGITYFLLDMSSEGIDVRPLRELTGEEVFNEVFLDNVLVLDDGVVGGVDGGWPLARTTLANERVAMSGSSLGASLERALDVLGHRHVGEAVRLRLGAAVADASTVTMLGTRATRRSVVGQGPGPESSVQKLVGVRHRQEAAEFAFDLLGPDALLGGAPADEAARAVADSMPQHRRGDDADPAKRRRRADPRSAA